jgi:hypothetical protein
LIFTIKMLTPHLISVNNRHVHSPPLPFFPPSSADGQQGLVPSGFVQLTSAGPVAQITVAFVGRDISFAVVPASGSLLSAQMAALFPTEAQFTAGPLLASFTIGSFVVRKADFRVSRNFSLMAAELDLSTSASFTPITGLTIASGARFQLSMTQTPALARSIVSRLTAAVTVAAKTANVELTFDTSGQVDVAFVFDRIAAAGFDNVIESITNPL